MLAVTKLHSIWGVHMNPQIPQISNFSLKKTRIYNVVLKFSRFSMVVHPPCFDASFAPVYRSHNSTKTAYRFFFIPI